MRTDGQFPNCSDRLAVHVDVRFVRGPNRPSTGPRTLHPVNRAVAFENSVGIEARLLKLTGDVAREDENAAWQTVAPAFENFKTGMGHGVAIEMQPMAEEAPRLGRIGVELMRIRHFVKLPTAKRWVRFPEAFVAAKIGKPGIDAHARAGADEEGVSGRDGGCGACEKVIEWAIREHLGLRSSIHQIARPPMSSANP